MPALHSTVVCVLGICHLEVPGAPGQEVHHGAAGTQRQPGVQAQVAGSTAIAIVGTTYGPLAGCTGLRSCRSSTVTV